MDKLKLIKGIVILLTSLIIIGVTAIIMGLVTKNDKPSINLTGPETIASTTISESDTILIPEPKGSRISTVTGCGGNICMLITDGGETPRLAILSGKGNLIRKVKLSE